MITLTNTTTWLIAIVLALSPTLHSTAHANETQKECTRVMELHPNPNLDMIDSTIISSEPSIHPGELAEVAPHTKKDTKLSTKIMNHVKGTSHFQKDRGLMDPQLPIDISFKPATVPFPPHILIPGIETAISSGHISLNALTHDLLEALSPEELNVLFTYLNTQSVRVRLTRKSKWCIHPVESLDGYKTNAAAATTLKLGIQGKHTMFAELIALMPESTLPILKEKAPSLLSTAVTATALLSMMKALNHKNTIIISRAATALIYIYIKYWAGKDANLLHKHLTDLVLQIHEDKGNLQELTSKQLGVLLGSLLSGTLTHCSKIKAADIQRQWLVNSSSNLVWAATTFLGVAPWFSGNVAAVMAGSISIGAVSVAIAYNILRVPRNYASIVRGVEGEIKVSALDLAGDDIERRQRVSEMLEWIDAIIELNGQPA